MSGFWTLDVQECSPSTQDHLKKLADEGVSEGTCVQALEQRRGHGRHGRVWYSPLGNLYLSALLRPECPAPRGGEFSFLAGVAVAKTVRAFTSQPDQVCLKWPNDVLIDGRKVAGLLIETGLRGGGMIDYIVLGMGVNIESAPLEGACCLNEYAGQDCSVDEFRDVLLGHIEALYALWRKQGFEPIRSEWLALAHGAGTALKIKLGEEKLEGYFQGLDERGNLLLEDDAGRTRVIHTGDVYIN